MLQSGIDGCQKPIFALTWGACTQETPQFAAELDHVIQLTVYLHVLHPGWHVAHRAPFANMVTYARSESQK